MCGKKNECVKEVDEGMECLQRVWVSGDEYEELEVLPGQVMHAGSSHPDDRLVKMSLLYWSERCSSGEGRSCSQRACSPEERMSDLGCQNVDASGEALKV